MEYAKNKDTGEIISAVNDMTAQIDKKINEAKNIIFSKNFDKLGERCPECGAGILRIVNRRSDGHPFLGCSNYKQGCKYSLNIG